MGSLNHTGISNISFDPQRRRLRLSAEDWPFLAKDSPKAVRGYRRTLWLMTKKVYEQAAAILTSGPWALRPDLTQVQMAFLGGAEDISFDKQGRCVLSERMVKHLGLGPDETELVAVGLGSRLQVMRKCDFEEWESKQLASDEFEKSVNGLNLWPLPDACAAAPAPDGNAPIPATQSQGGG